MRCSGERRKDELRRTPVRGVARSPSLVAGSLRRCTVTNLAVVVAAPAVTSTCCSNDARRRYAVSRVIFSRYARPCVAARNKHRRGAARRGRFRAGRKCCRPSSRQRHRSSRRTLCDHRPQPGCAPLWLFSEELTSCAQPLNLHRRYAPCEVATTESTFGTGLPGCALARAHARGRWPRRRGDACSGQRPYHGPSSAEAR